VKLKITYINTDTNEVLNVIDKLVVGILFRRAKC